MTKKKWFSREKEWTAEETKKKNQERIEEINQQLHDGVKQILQSPDWQEQIRSLLLFKSKLHQYSFGNTIRILMQYPAASYVASFTTWTQKFRRKVKRGAKAIYVLAPRIIQKEDEKTGDRKAIIIGWGTEAVFDITQTEETPESVPVLLSLGYELIGDTKPGRWLKEKLFELGKRENIKVDYGDTGRASGYYVPSKHVIRLSSSLASVDEECMVFLHEMIHAFRHAKGSQHSGERNDYAEVIVEGAAFMIAAFYGLEVDQYSFTYIASWAKDVETLLTLGTEVEKEAKRFIHKIETLSEEAMTELQDSKQQLESLFDETYSLKWMDKKGNGEERDYKGRHNHQ